MAYVGARVQMENETFCGQQQLLIYV
jgi:hypothetical protein